jgi:tetratricopeptide (TPR) repeat protein
LQIYLHHQQHFLREIMIRLLFHSCRFITFTYILTLMLIVFPKSARAQSPIHPHDPGSLLLFQALGEGLEAADADGLVRRTLQNRALTDLNNARLTGDRVAEAIALEEVGILTGREEGISYLEQAQSIFRSLGRFDDEALTVYRIGDLHEKMGNFQQAFAYYQQAINIVEMHSTPRAKIMKITIAILNDS